MLYDILIFGAAFDPPHLGQEQVVRSVIEKELTNEVWLVPCKQHPFAKHMSDNLDREKMAESMVGNRIKLSRLEMEREGMSYAYDTLGEVKALFPDKKIGWLMGSDLVVSFEKWYKYEEILREFGVLVYPRAGSEKVKTPEGMEWITGVNEVTISSTEIRELVKMGGIWKNMVRPAVAKYIEEHGLYAR